MAITTLDGMIAGMQPSNYIAKVATPVLTIGRPQSLYYLDGMPGPGSAPAASLNGVSLTSMNGQIPFTNPAGGNTYLARFTGHIANNAGMLLLCDRLWHNGGITITSTAPHTIVSPTWPARDNLGSTNGHGVLLGAEVSVVTGAGTPTLTVGYTSSDGVATRTGTNIQATSATSAVGSFYQIGLQAGDKGVRSVQSFTLSATWTSGTINLVAYRVLAALPYAWQNTGQQLDALTGGFPKMYDNSCPFLIYVPAQTTAANVSGQVTYSQG